MSPPHAFRDGKLTSVSASQIKTYRRCARKWYFEKVKHVVVEQSRGQSEGESIHSGMENYYLTGDLPEHPASVRLIESGEIPPRDPALLVEQPKDFNMKMTAADVPVKGRIDLTVPPKVGETSVAVWDWKSTSNFKYSSSPAELREDVQGVVYLHFAFRRYPAVEDGTFLHAYIHKRNANRSTHRVVSSGPMTRAEVAEQYTGIEATVREMIATAAIEDPLQVPGNGEACGDYGGCPYRDLCTDCPWTATYVDPCRPSDRSDKR